MTDDELRKTYGIAGCGIPHEYTELHVRGLCAVAAAALREADKRPELMVTFDLKTGRMKER